MLNGTCYYWYVLGIQLYSVSLQAFKLHKDLALLSPQVPDIN